MPRTGPRTLPTDCARHSPAQFLTPAVDSRLAARQPPRASSRANSSRRNPSPEGGPGRHASGSRAQHRRACLRPENLPFTPQEPHRSSPGETPLGAESAGVADDRIHAAAPGDRAIALATAGSPGKASYVTARLPGTSRDRRYGERRCTVSRSSGCPLGRSRRSARQSCRCSTAPEASCGARPGAALIGLLG